MYRSGPQPSVANVDRGVERLLDCTTWLIKIEYFVWKCIEAVITRRSWKPFGWKPPGVRIPPLPPKNSTSFDLSNFFIHCESNGISSRRSRGYHHRRCISSAVGCIFFRNDDIQGFRLGDIQNFVLIIYTPLAWLGRYSSKPNKKGKNIFFIAPSQTKPALEKVWVFCLLWINKAPQKRTLGVFCYLFSFASWNICLLGIVSLR